MKELEIKKWDNYSYEDKSSLLSFWWNRFAIKLITEDLDTTLTTNWWYKFGKSVMTLDDWKRLEKIERDARKEIALLKDVYCDLNSDINIHFMDNYNPLESNRPIIKSLVCSYNAHCSTDSIGPVVTSKQYCKS